MTEDTRPDLRNSYLEHQAMRVDAARLSELVGAARPHDADRLRALDGWYAGYLGAIDDHHRAEEAVIYPALLERDPSFADADAQLETEHRVLLDRLQVARECISGLADAAGGSRWERERGLALQATRALEDILDIHLPHEEEVAFPRYTAAFTGAEFDDLGRKAFRLVGMRSVIFTGPWVLGHATPADQAHLLAPQPLLLRLLYRLWLKPRYERLARPLRLHAVPARDDEES
jgi:hemerythrin-like domain-containing protein